MIVSEPAVTPETTPPEVMVAVVGLLLDHVPPATVSDKVTVEDGHTEVAPVIAPANAAGVTEIVEVATAVPQLLVTEYEILATPPATPVTTPVVAPTVATVPSLVLQVPPEAPSVKVLETPAHNVDTPVTVPATGSGLTVIGKVTVTVPHEATTV
jgi:hypothetical protein